MKKIIPILLLSLILFSQLGYYCISLVRQHIAKEETAKQILSGIPESSLDIFDLKAEQDHISWEEKGREFSFKGNMYDVVKTVTTDGRTLLYCLSDKKEDELLKERAASVCSILNQHSNNQVKKVMSFFHLSDCLVAKNELIQIKDIHYKNCVSAYDVSIALMPRPVNTPPPNFLYNAFKL